MVKRGVSFLWWPVVRFRVVLFPDVKHHNWAGKSKERWWQILTDMLGLTSDHLRVSERSARALAKESNAPAEDPNFSFEFSTAGAMGMCVYWSRSDKTATDAGKGLDKRAVAHEIVDGIVERFLGNTSITVQVKATGGELDIRNGFVRLNEVEHLGATFAVVARRVRCRGPSSSSSSSATITPRSEISLFTLNAELLEITMRPSRLRSCTAEEARFGVGALLEAAGTCADMARFDPWLNEMSMLDAPPVLINTRCSRASPGFKDAVAQAAADNPELGGARRILANMKYSVASGCGGRSASSAKDVTRETTVRFFVDQREEHKHVKALHLSIDGLRVGNDATDVGFAYAPCKKIGSIPPIQVSVCVHKNDTNS